MGLLKDKLKEIFPTFAPLLDDDLEDIVKNKNLYQNNYSRLI